MPAPLSAKRLLSYYRYCLSELETDVSDQRREILEGKAQFFRRQLVSRFGEQFGECTRCHALLTDPVSIARQMGPDCAQVAS